MQTENAQRVSRRFFILGCIVLTVAVGYGLLQRLAHPDWPQVLIPVLIGIAVALFYIQTSMTAARVRAERRSDPPMAPGTYYRAGWIIGFVFAALMATFALTNWSTSDATLERSAWFVFTLPVFYLMQVVANKRAMHLSWPQAIASEYEIEPRDEREEHIVQRASQVSVSLNVFLTLVLLVILIVAPLPSKYALVNVFVALIFLQLSLRSFLVWLLGIR